MLRAVTKFQLAFVHNINRFRAKYIRQFISELRFDRVDPRVRSGKVELGRNFRKDCQVELGPVYANIIYLRRR